MLPGYFNNEQKTVKYCNVMQIISFETIVLCYYFLIRQVSSSSRDGLVGYDAALTQLRSRVQFPVFVMSSPLLILCFLFIAAKHTIALAQVKKESEDGVFSVLTKEAMSV